MNLRRFWIEFELDESDQLPFGVAVGCGVTALDRDDALKLIRDDLFSGGILPKIKRIIEDVDVASLDAHVRPNMRTPTDRGVWFPLH